MNGDCDHQLARRRIRSDGQLQKKEPTDHWSMITNHSQTPWHSSESERCLNSRKSKWISISSKRERHCHETRWHVTMQAGLSGLCEYGKLLPKKTDLTWNHTVILRKQNKLSWDHLCQQARLGTLPWHTRNYKNFDKRSQVTSHNLQVTTVTSKYCYYSYCTIIQQTILYYTRLLEVHISSWSMLKHETVIVIGP